MLQTTAVCTGIGWIHLAQDRDERRAFVNTVMGLCVPYKAGTFLTRCCLISARNTVTLTVLGAEKYRLGAESGLPRFKGRTEGQEAPRTTLSICS
jgi:hypothetical protein